MSDAQLAVGMDRLPWLADEPQPRTARGSSERATWAVAAVLLVAGTFYWMGAHSWREPASAPQPKMTVSLPEAAPVQAEPQIKAAPEVERVAGSSLPVLDYRPHVAAKPSPPSTIEVAQKAETTALADAPAPKAAEPLQPWPARVVDGASGRLVWVGAFATPHQAKKGWWGIVRMNPALQRLPALVVPVQSLRNGATYYRLQMGTTSQAHSEVLCQRLRMVALSCVVLGLSGARAEGVQ